MRAEYLSLKLKENMEIVEFDNEGIIMDTEHFTITKVNTVGADILTALSKRKSFEEIVQHIQIKYGVDEHVARSDSLAFLQEIEKVGLLTNDRE